MAADDVPTWSGVWRKLVDEATSEPVNIPSPSSSAGWILTASGEGETFTLTMAHPATTETIIDYYAYRLAKKRMDENG
jgi:hypothetical protein